MRVTFTNFPKEYKILQKELKKKFDKIGLKGQYVLGSELQLFEKKIAHGFFLVLNAIQLDDSRQPHLGVAIGLGFSLACAEMSSTRYASSRESTA